MTILALGLLVASFPGHPGQGAKQSRISLVPVVSDDRVEDIQESPDGTRLITHDRGFAPRLWDPKSMRVIRVLGGHRKPVHSVTFSPRGEWIVTAEDTAVSVWDSLLGRKRSELPALKDDAIECVGMSVDGRKVAVGTRSGNIGVFETLKPSTVIWWKGSDKLLNSIEFAPDGKRILTSGNDHLAKVWNENGTPVSTCSGAQEPVRWANFSVDGTQVLATAVDNTARLFDASTGKQLFSWQHIIGEKGMMLNTLMSALFVQKDGAGVLVAGPDGTMQIYDRHDGHLLRELKGNTGAVREIRKSRDGSRLGTYSTAEELKLWDIESGKEMPFTRPEGSPTAGEFSPNGDVFWVGYGDGTIRRHELATGAIRSETPGQVKPITKVALKNGRLWTQFPTVYEGFSASYPNFLWNIQSPESAGGLGTSIRPCTVSPDGGWMVVPKTESETRLGNMATGKVYIMKNLAMAVFSPDSKFLLAINNDMTLSKFALADFKSSWGLQGTKDQQVRDAFFSPDGEVIGLILENGEVSLYDADNGNLLSEVGKATGFDPHGAIDGKARVAVSTSEGMRTWTLKNKKWEQTFVAYPADKDQRKGHLFFTPDGRSVAYASTYTTSIYSLETGQLEYENVKSEDNGADQDNSPLHPTKPWLLSFQGASVGIWDYRQKMLVGGFVLADQCVQAFFTDDGSRIVTVDGTDSVSVWDASTTLPKKLGSFCVASDEGWLAIDPEGRFDAHDPSHVNGASYVFEWSGGLETIEVSQLKSQFYEPDLLAKIFGLNKEPVRPAPDLSSLHLYPTVQTELKGSKLSVSLRERDEGGLGKLAVFVNGKQVFSKDGLGFSEFDLSQFQSAMLPESQLGGHGNIITIQAWNEDGTLASAPKIIDVGVPKEIKTPPVNLYALCVGVGKYSGHGKGDLKAPPSDATSISQAIAQVAGRLLPNRVSISTLASGTPDLPTKVAISKWFEETSKKATSSDILFVFFAGHGTSQIGDKKDYFFLTAEADPSDLTPISAQTGAISGDELRVMLGKVSANKQVVVLDTCHSGAAASDLVATRSVSSEYQRAYENIKDATGTWLLAGAASDQLSYESSNVEHGMLTYALLEAIDQTRPSALRAGEGTDLFVDVERWLTYAVDRVDSLKSEVGVPGVQRPELRRSQSRSSFDIGVTSASEKGSLGLKAPKPIVIVGNFQKDEEDPLGLETEITKNLGSASGFKAWFDVAKHPNVYRVAGTYEIAGDKVTVKMAFQKFDSSMSRKTLEAIEIVGSTKDLPNLAETLRKAIDAALVKYTTKEGAN